MLRMRLVALPVLAFIALFGQSRSAIAGYTSIVAFGDSLSDTGNVFAASGGTNPASPPYFQGHYSNGPIWLELLAKPLGVAAPKPSLAGGTDFAFGGAESGTGNSLQGTPNLLSQVAMFQGAGGTLTANDLVSIWIGANDILGAGQTNPQVIVNNVANAITQLAALGGKEFLVSNLPDLGNIPATNTLPQAQRDGLNAITQGYNVLLALKVAELKANLGITIHESDIASLFRSTLANPSAFGFTNVTQGALLVNAPNPNEYLFWDAFHPTAAASQFISNTALSAVPEPASVALMVLGVVGLSVPVFRARKRRAA